MGFKSVPTLVGYSESNVNLKTTGATLIFTNPNSQGLYFPYKIRIYGTNLAGVVTPPTFSIGTNASNYNNILAFTASAGLVDDAYIDYNVSYPLAPIAVNTQVFVNVTIGAVGTTYGCRFAVYMDYF